MAFNVRRLALGDPLPTAHEVHHRLVKVQALAVFSSDALSSVTYATEETLLVLAGTGVLQLSLAIAGLLAIVGSSYYQTVQEYLSGRVAGFNLSVGDWPIT
jgi:hypothetical protein